MKRILLCFLCFLQTFAAFSMTCHAQPEAYNWYCVHAKDHVQPRVSGELAFVEEIGGYYIDHKHTAAEDAEKVIYLTFDAGYENGNVAKILDVLNTEGAPAAFFVLGHLIESEPALIKRMADEGHLVCNHTVRHKDMSGFEDADFLEELRALERLCEEKTGTKISHYYRPPEGRFSRNNLVCAKENGYQTIFWSFAYPDWDNGKQPDLAKAKKTILDNAHNGEVMLLHPTSATNAAILGEVIQSLRAEGYRFGTLDELTGER
ncbi:MAG: polysaccharide deacetylase family protein [Clostridia bacterium]|nr:polysaccharide deacetylase family protein [Clostridia bacterium]